jgi:hypothetical protein
MSDPRGDKTPMTDYLRASSGQESQSPPERRAQTPAPAATDAVSTPSTADEHRAPVDTNVIDASEVTSDTEGPRTLRVIPTIYPTSPAVETQLANFYQAGPGLAEVRVDVEYPERSLELLELLGPSPFPRSEFPLIGFLATTYDKVSRYACDRDNS